jgi:hypothetical protein
MIGAIPSTRTLSAKFSEEMLKRFCEQPVTAVASNTHNKSSFLMKSPCRRHAMPDLLSLLIADADPVFQIISGLQSGLSGMCRRHI